jgi:hypothetical protein
MGIESQRDISLHPYVLGGRCVTRREQVAQDGGRSGNMVIGTVMAYDSANTNWVPFSDATATDGTQIPCGILYETLTEAAIQAGNIDNVTIIVNDAILNEDLLTWESSTTKDDVVTVPTNFKQSAEQCLADKGLILVDTLEATSYEA